MKQKKQAEAVRELWIVEGSTGEYSDHIEWPICFYESEDLARAHVEKAKARAGELLNECGGDRWRIKAGANEWDPGMQIDYTGVNYWAYSVKRGPLEAGR